LSFARPSVLPPGGAAIVTMPDLVRLVAPAETELTHVNAGCNGRPHPHYLSS